MSRSRLLAASLVGLLSPLALSSVHALELGSNLAPVGPSSPAIPFNDLIKNSGGWQTKKLNNTNFESSKLTDRVEFDEFGWPTSAIPFKDDDGNDQIIYLSWTSAATPASSATSPFTLYFEGNGTLRINGRVVGGVSGQNTVTAAPGAAYTVAQVYPSTTAIDLAVIANDPAKPVKNIRLIAPGAYNSATRNVTQTFNQTYLNSLAFYTGPLRFMDWTKTNDSSITSVRPSINDRTQADTGGVAIEYEVEFANAAKRDLWINIPHRATDAYVSSVAAYIATNLSSGLKVWVEYSNEVWNGDFGQYAYAADQALALFGSKSRWPQFYAKRSAEIWTIFQTAFSAASAAPARVVRVLGAQTVGLSNGMMANAKLADYGQKADVFSPAAYIPGGTFASSTDNFDTGWAGGSNRVGATWDPAGWTRTPAANITLVDIDGGTAVNNVARITNNGSITRTVDTTGTTGARLSFNLNYKATGFEAGDTALVQIDPAGTGQWITAATITSADATGTNKSTPMLDLAPFTPSAATKVRVQLNGDDADDVLQINEVWVFGHPSADYLLDTYIPERIPQLAGWLKGWVDYASEQNAVLYTYEGGQHFNETTQLENNIPLWTLLNGIQKDPRMQARYTEWLRALQAIGVQGVTHYYDIGPYNKYGSWGAFNYHGQPSSETPKLNALKAWAASNQPATFTEEALESYYSDNGESQDATPAAYSIADGGTTLVEGPGNVWKRLAYGYRATAKTRLTFEAKVTASRELHGVGLDNDTRLDELKFFRIAGTQTRGTLVGAGATLADGWKRYDVTVGALSQPVYYLIFAADDDAAPSDAAGSFRNVKLYEAP